MSYTMFSRAPPHAAGIRARGIEAVGAVGDNRNLFQKGYWLANLRLGWEGEHWSIAAYIKNLLDEEYIGYGVDIRSAIGADYIVRGERRAFGVEATYRFDTGL